MSILAFPEPKLAMTAGAQTEASRRPNWSRIAAVATTRLEPSGSYDWGPSHFRFAAGNPRLCRSAHTWASHATTADRLTCCSIQVTARALAAASPLNGGLVPAWLPAGGCGDGPCRARMSVAPPATATSRIEVRTAAARQRDRARPMPRRAGCCVAAGCCAAVGWAPFRPSSLPFRGPGTAAGPRGTGDALSSVGRAGAIGGSGPASRAPAAASSLSAPRADGLMAGSLLRQRRTIEPSGSGSHPTVGSE